MFPGLEDGYDDLTHDTEIINGKKYEFYKDGGKVYGINEDGRKCILNKSKDFRTKETLYNFFW